MHKSQREHMQRCIRRYLRENRHYRVIDVGSAKSRAGHPSHKDLLAGLDCEYVGVDVRGGENVDVVMRKPYRIPLPTNTADVVLSGSAFEHIPFFWVTFLEMCRITAPGGFVFVIVPSRGNPHGGVDCWRMYADAMRALAAFGRMRLLEAHTDFPPRDSNGRRFDYSRVDEDSYWGDTVGVFRKPKHYSRLVRVTREVAVWWADRVGGVHDIPRTPRPGVVKRRANQASPDPEKN